MMTKTRNEMEREERSVQEIMERISDTVKSIQAIQEYMNSIVEMNR